MVIASEKEMNHRNDALTQSLNGLRKFRAECGHLEKVVASYAMREMGFAQRRTATMLGVGLSAFNKLLQAADAQDKA